VLGQSATADVTIAPTGSTSAVLVGTGVNTAKLYTRGTTSLAFGQDQSGVKVEWARLTNSTGNLLIGGTTDITGSGGLKVFGTTAASSTTSGALQVAGGVGVAGAGYFGGVVQSAGAAQSNNGTVTTYVLSSGTSGYLGTQTAHNLVLQTGGANRITVANGTGDTAILSTSSASSSTVGALTIGNGTAATNVAIGGGKIVSGDVFNSVKTGNGAQNAFGFSTASAIGWTYTSIDVNDVNGGIIAPYLNGSCFGYLTVNAAGPLLQSRNNYAAQVFNSTNIGLSVAHSTGNVTFNSSTASTNTTSGALVVTGGVGVGGALNVGGNVTVAGTGIQVNAAGFGGAPNSYYAISSTQTLSGNGNQAFLNVSPTFNADAAGGQGNVLWVQGKTAASYTLAALAGLKVESPSIGAGGAVTTVYGLRIQDQTGGGTNYAIFTGAGRVSFGDLVFPQQAATAPTYVKGAIYFDTTLNKLRVGGATAWETITSV